MAARFRYIIEMIDEFTKQLLNEVGEDMGNYLGRGLCYG